MSQSQDSMPLFENLEEKAEINEQFDPNADIVFYPGDVHELLDEIPDGSIQLIVTSPPYNVGKEYETQKELDVYLEQIEQTIKELYRVLAPEGSICWQVGNYIEDGEVYPLDIYYYPIFKRLGMQLRNRVVWHFGHGLHARNRLSGRYETLLWFTKTDDYTFNLDDIRVPAKYPGKRSYKGPNKGKPSGNPKGKNPSDVWNIVAESWETAFWEIPNCKANHREKTIHPAQFPIALVERCILAFTSEGDWVLDPYAGVGTSLVAAIKNNRRAMGAEIMEEYIEVARGRIHNYFNGTLAYRPLGKPVYKPTGKSKVSQIPEEWQNGDEEEVHEAYNE